MEKKNMVLLTVIAVATLLVAVVGATFAFFASSVNDDRSADANGNRGTANVSTANMNSNTITKVANIDKAAGSFTAENVYPGHKEVAGLSVTATSENNEATDSPVNFLYNVTKNDIGKNIKVRLYKAVAPVETDDTNALNCSVQISTGEDGKQNYTETCSVEESKFGTMLREVTLKGGAEGVNLGSDVLSVPAGADASATGYYYVVVEYVETGADQTEAEAGKELAGQILVA